MEKIENIEDIQSLNSNTVAIWGLQVSACDDQVKSLYKVLTPEEQQKADHFHSSSQQEVSILARGALRILLGAYINTNAKRLCFSKTNSGKPFLEHQPFTFNVSHSKDWIIIAIGVHHHIGVDLEAIRSHINIHGIAKRYFSSDEQHALRISKKPLSLFFDLWSHKEALVKAKGDRLLTSIKSINVPIFKEQVATECCIEEWNLYTIEAGSKYAAALAVDANITQRPCYDFGALKWEN